MVNFTKDSFFNHAVHGVKFKFLPQDFSPYNEISVVQALSALLAMAKCRQPMDSYDAQGFYEFYSELSDVLAEAHTRLELRVLMGTDIDNAQRELSAFEATVYKRVIQSRGPIFDAFFALERQITQNDPSLFSALFSDLRRRQEFSVVRDPDLLLEESDLVLGVRRLFSGSDDENSQGLRRVIAGLQAFDPRLRAQAYQKAQAHLHTHAGDLFNRFFDLWSVRNRVAQSAGASCYPSYRRNELGRFGSSLAQDALLRQQIKEQVVPCLERLCGATQELRYAWNQGFINPLGQLNVSTYSEAQVFHFIQDLLKDFSPHWFEIWQHMIREQNLDVSLRPRKQTGAFTVPLPVSGGAFIFCHCGGGFKDLMTLCHEVGHAIHIHVASETHKKHPLMRLPCIEICETIALFFEAVATHKFLQERGMSSNAALELMVFPLASFLPQVALADEWQHFVFDPKHSWEKPKSQARKDWCDYWAELGTVYFPHVSEVRPAHGGMGRQGWLLRQHLFLNPFYYIEYAWAHIMSFQIFLMYQKNGCSLITKLQRVMEAGAHMSIEGFCAEFEMPLPFSPEALGNVTESFFARR